MIINEPSNNIDVEKQILGALLKDPTHSNCRETLDSLGDDDFYSRVHRLIYRTIKALSENKVIADLVTVTNELEKSGDDFGGFVYVAEMNRNTTGPYNLPAYVSIIKKCAQLRNLSVIINNASELINQSVDANEIIELLEVRPQ